MTARPDQSTEFEVVRQFTAYIVQNAGKTEDPRPLRKGSIIRTEIESETASTPESALVVRFLWNDNWFYVDRETFLDCTRKK